MTEDQQQAPSPAAGWWKIAAIVAAVGLALMAAALLSGRAQRDAATPSPSVIAVATPPATVCENASPTTVSRRAPRNKPYPMTIDPDATYFASLETSCGTMKIRLRADRAPIAVNNFINLAEDDFFRGMVFHRIDRELGIIQSGDPTCPVSIEQCGTGGPGFTIDDEFRNGLVARQGSVLMASAGTPDSSGSQFEIVAEDTGVKIPVARTVFGELVGQHSTDVAALILSTPTKVAPNAPETAPEDFPDGEYVYIMSVTITEKR